MSKEDLKNEKNGAKWASFKLWLYNPTNHTVLNRTGMSWLKVGVFYLVFYLCLAAFWALMMKIFMSTISYEKPKWEMEESLIGLNPGLGYRPSPKFENVDSTLIHFRPGRNESFYPWVQDLKNFLKPYKKAYETNSNCRGDPKRECPFVVNLNDHPCGPNFGFDTGSPCILIKLNRVYNWRPSPYRSSLDIKEGIKKSPRPPQNLDVSVPDGQLKSNEGLISVQCEGENQIDKESLSKIEYWPRQGFPVEYFPYTNQKGYLSPFVLVKFNKPKIGKQIRIECFAFDKNIAINRFDKEGSVSYQLLIDSNDQND